MKTAHPVILFYKYIAIADAENFAERQRELCGALGLKGRILIATEGINGTLAGPEENVNRYVASLRANQRFADIEIKVSAGDAETFPQAGCKDPSRNCDPQRRRNRSGQGQPAHSR